VVGLNIAAEPGGARPGGGGGINPVLEMCIIHGEFFHYLGKMSKMKKVYSKNAYSHIKKIYNMPKK
jgi:hypothetical protein